jgi:plasmid stabilization system protein ParE
MAHTVIWSPRAIDDVESIAAYIAGDSEAYAASVVRVILTKARSLAEFPYMGRVVPEFDDENIREVFAYSYRIIYKVAGDEVTIATVVHGSRMLELAVKP